MADSLFTDPQVGLRALLERDIEAPPGRSLNFGDWPGPGLSDQLIYVAVEEVVGSAVYTRADYIVSVDVFAPTRALARSVSQAIRDYLLGYPGGVRIAEEGYFQPDDVSCTQTPRPGDWEDTNIRRQSAQYSFSARS